MQVLQDYLKEKAAQAFEQAQKEVVDSINTAQNQIDKLEAVKADWKRKLDEVSQKVGNAKKELDAITKAR